MKKSPAYRDCIHLAGIPFFMKAYRQSNMQKAGEHPPISSKGKECCIRIGELHGSGQRELPLGLGHES